LDVKLGVSHQTPEGLTEERLAFLKGMGVDAVEVRVPSMASSYDDIVAIKAKVEGAGIALHEIMLSDKYSTPEVCLGLPGRDETVALIKRFITDLGRAGIKHTTYAWLTLGVYETEKRMTRGIPTRGFTAAAALGRAAPGGAAHTDDELWRNYERFIAEVLPVAEAADVRLQLHPNDPPISHLGVARIFRDTASHRRAVEIAGGSPHAGFLFCVGTFGEMEQATSTQQIIDAIHEFGPKGLLHQIHFRNVDESLPSFAETFPDNGFLDMPAIVRALAEVGFTGMIVPDHVPDTSGLTGGAAAGEAFCLGYIRALIQANR
jgi:mannonate dehydratase